MGNDLSRVQVVSWISLFFIPTQCLLFYMGIQTNKRGAASFQVSHWLELIILFVVIWWILTKSEADRFDAQNTMVKIIDEFLGGSNPPKVMSDNLKLTSHIIYKSYENESRFEYILSTLVIASWLKFFFSLRVTKLFGPMYKILYSVVEDLLKFLIIWVFVILMFTCMALLAFSQIETF